MRNEGWGWRWPWPIESVTKVNVANINSADYKPRVLTSDVNLVDLHFSVQYQYTDPIKILFKGARPGCHPGRSERGRQIREVVGRSELDQGAGWQHAPADHEARQGAHPTATLDYYNTGITVTTVNLIDVQVPDAVIASQRDANKALADQERFIKEAQAYANSIIPVAQGAGARMGQEAQAYKAQVVAIAEGQAARFSELAASLRGSA